MEKMFRVFCAREKQQMLGGIGALKDFYVYHIAAVKDVDELIVHLPKDEED